ncbi:hypothetical protein NDU88_005742 [Pleurodeles waltl]|uniref:Uncharacterized protein n=1 Tax=Pleurodeles waltl TaxID=8319 RepID=A0AAV7RJH5_PLEWA|nr:hypothetical protein NDU88_005742 [Pleurodeles waltl]
MTSMFVWAQLEKLEEVELQEEPEWWSVPNDSRHGRLENADGASLNDLKATEQKPARTQEAEEEDEEDFNIRTQVPKTTYENKKPEGMGIENKLASIINLSSRQLKFEEV